MSRKIIRKTDDMAIVHETASDGSKLCDVEVYFEDNAGKKSKLTIGCTDAWHATRLFKQLEAAAHVTFDEVRG